MRQPKYNSISILYFVMPYINSAAHDQLRRIYWNSDLQPKLLGYEQVIPIRDSLLSKPGFIYGKIIPSVWFFNVPDYQVCDKHGWDREKYLNLCLYCTNAVTYLNQTMYITAWNGMVEPPHTKRMGSMMVGKNNELTLYKFTECDQ